MRMIMLAVVALAGSGVLSSAEAQTFAGELRCTIAGGIGVVVAGDRAATCLYRAPGRSPEFYSGHVGRLGLDFGPTNARVVTYKVAAADPTAPGSLDGDFVGPSVSLTGGSGFSADSLIGGSTGTIALLPIPSGSLTAATGFNVSAGIAALHLQFVAVEEPLLQERRRHVR